MDRFEQLLLESCLIGDKNYPDLCEHAEGKKNEEGEFYWYCCKYRKQLKVYPTPFQWKIYPKAFSGCPVKTLFDPKRAGAEVNKKSDG